MGREERGGGDRGSKSPPCGSEPPNFFKSILNVNFRNKHFKNSNRNKEVELANTIFYSATHSGVGEDLPTRLVRADEELCQHIPLTISKTDPRGREA